MSNLEKLRELRRQRVELKEEIEEMERELKDLNKAIFAELVDLPQEEFVDEGLVTTIVRPKKISYDWEGIKHEVGLVKWKKIVKEVPDPDKAAKLVPTSTLAKFSTSEPGTAYVKIAKAREESD